MFILNFLLILFLIYLKIFIFINLKTEEKLKFLFCFGIKNIIKIVTINMLKIIFEIKGKVLKHFNNNDQI